MTAPASFAPAPEVYALRSGQTLALHATGIRHPRFPTWAGETFTPYPDVTHHEAGLRAFRLATRRSAYLFPRSAFVEASAPDDLARSLVDRIAALPGGAAQLERMFEAEKRAARPNPVRATYGLMALCAAVYALQLVLPPSFLYAGFFNATLVQAGELWRLVTANLLHQAVPLHMHFGLNLLGLFLLGRFVEWILGPAATLVVMVASGFGATLAGLLAGYENMVGVSGVVSGLVGAILWLDFFQAERLPVGWRIPRGFLLTVVAAEMILLPILVPVVAGAAHLGGLLGGALAAGLVAGAALGPRPLPGWIPRSAAASVAVVLLAVGTAGYTLAEGPERLVRHASKLAAARPPNPLVLNDFAWMIATHPRVSQADAEVALQLAERAVEITERREPNILDTLAEAQFAAGQPGDAVQTIDEALGLATDAGLEALVVYLTEQRRRFTGERDADDRPPPPGAAPRRTPPEKEAPAQAPGVPI